MFVHPCALSCNKQGAYDFHTLASFKQAAIFLDTFWNSSTWGVAYQLVSTLIVSNSPTLKPKVLVGTPFVTNSFDDISLFVPCQDIIQEKPYPVTLTLEASSQQKLRWVSNKPHRITAHTYNMGNVPGWRVVSHVVSFSCFKC